MAQANLAPFELISYRGLLKSAHDIKNDYFTRRPNKRDDKAASNKSEITNSRKHFIKPMRDFIIFHFALVINAIEKFLFYLMSCYDLYIYSPLQICLKPIVKQIPRYINIFETKVPIFTANIITFGRTFLVIPIAWCLKYEYNQVAFGCVILHDFLDHLDGIVAKVHRESYPNKDDPLLGGFLDAFCDKIVNVLSLWTIIQMIDLNKVNEIESFFFLAVSYAVISYESIIGVVRVQDFFLAKFKREFKIPDKNGEAPDDQSKVTMASMEGKLKEKLESSGIALLCLSISKQYENPIYNISGISGLICLALTLRMAHKSLSLKIKARQQNQTPTLKNGPRCSVWGADLSEMVNNSKELAATHPSFESAQMKSVDLKGEQIVESNSLIYKKPIHDFDEDEDEMVTDIKSSNKAELESDLKTSNNQQIMKIPNLIDNRVDKVYTVGCFDLFHHGHVLLMKRMKEIGKKVIVGVHDSRSIYQLKKRVPIDSTEKRMLNVKTLADEVFCIAGPDPSNYMSCIVSLEAGETALYVRGDDMPDFPARKVVENLMPIKFLPYTQGVSSTQIRKESYAHISANDQDYLEKIENGN